MLLVLRRLLLLQLRLQLLLLFLNQSEQLHVGAAAALVA